MPSKYREYMKQRHIMGVYRDKLSVEKRANSLRGKFSEVTIKEGTKGKAWGKKRKVWRVWVRN